MLDDLRYRVRALFRRTAAETDLRDELDAHLDHRVRRFVAQGMSREDAVRRARVELGGLDPVKEACRDARGVSLIETIVQDLRYAARALVARPAFTVVALGTLALGLGLNAAVFTAVRSVLLRPLPFRDPEQLVRIGPDRTISNAELLEYQSRLRSFEQVAAFSPGWGVYVAGFAGPSHLDAARVSTNFFTTLGAKPALGRDFRPGESSAGAWNVVLLSDEIWRTQFGGDRGVIGRSISIDGIPHAIIGVVPHDFPVLHTSVPIWLPLQIDPASQFFTGQSALAIGRLRRGVTAMSAATEVASISSSIRERYSYPDDYGQGLRVIDLRESIAGSARGPLLALFGAGALIVLIAGANVGTLLLLRGASRQREIGVRFALGASRARVVRLLLSESLLLALGGCVLGLLLNAGAMRIVPSILPAAFPRRDEIGVDSSVFLAILALAVVIGVVFGLAPALLAGSSNAALSTRSARTDGTTRGSARVRSMLIVGEVALALVLSVGAGLMLRTVWSLYAVDMGFRADHVLTLRLEPDRARVSEPKQRPAYYSEILRQIGELPDVVSVGGSHHLPLSGFNWTGRVQIERDPKPLTSNLPRVVWRVVLGDYFRAMGIPVIRGRLFDARDVRDAPDVVVINDAMARHLWPDRDPVGERIRVENGTRNAWATVVGIVGNVRSTALDAPARDEMYRPILQQSQIFSHLVIRTRGEPMRALSAVQAAIRRVDAAAATSSAASLEDLVDRSIGQRRAVMQLLIVFAIVGAVLGIIGVHGVVAFAVAQRTRELGIRAALGARPGGMLLMVAGHGARLAAIGIGLGTLGAVGATRGLKGLLFGVSPSDPLTFVVLGCALLLVMLIASYVPARRALRIDPVIALQME
jgi:predicted permease